MKNIGNHNNENGTLGKAASGLYVKHSSTDRGRTLFDLRRVRDGARVELVHSEQAGPDGRHEVCTARLFDGWGGEEYDDCVFMAYRPVSDDLDTEDDHERGHWVMCWRSPAHDRAPTTWPGHFDSQPDENIESLLIRLLHRIEAGILLVERTCRELETGGEGHCCLSDMRVCQGCGRTDGETYTDTVLGRVRKRHVKVWYTGYCGPCGKSMMRTDPEGFAQIMSDAEAEVLRRMRINGYNV